jgi:hypothetical protein
LCVDLLADTQPRRHTVIADTKHRGIPAGWPLLQQAVPPAAGRGIYLAPSASSGLLSAAHDSDSVGQLAAGLRDLTRDL